MTCAIGLVLFIAHQRTAGASSGADGIGCRPAPFLQLLQAKAGIAHKRYGINPKDLELWGVLTEVGQQFNKDFGAVIKLMDHMVLVYKGMVADNRQSFIYNQGWAGYDWVARSTYHDLSVWEGI